MPADPRPDARVKVIALRAEWCGVSAGSSCPQCGAATRPGAAWCSLCFAQVSGGFDPLTAPIEEVLGQVEGTTKTVAAPKVPASAMPPPAQPHANPLTAPQTEPLTEHGDIETYEYAVPHTVPNTVLNTVTTSSVAAGPSDEQSGDQLSEVDVMLAMLAAEHRQGDPTAKWLDRFGDKSSRVLIIISGTAVIGALVLLGLTILGAVT